MKKSFYTESVLLALVCILLVLLLNPLHIVMKLMLSAGLLLLLVVVYLVKVIVIWAETPQDERDLHHRFYASWMAYVAASLILFAGIVAEALQGTIDVWLIAALAGLLFTKLVVRTYLEIYR